MIKMNKAAFISIFLIMSCSLFADFKIIAGFDLARYKTESLGNNLTWEHKFGLSGGIGFEENLSRRVIIEFDSLYIHRGSQAVSADDHSIYKYCLNTISVPLLIKYKLFPHSSPYLLGGSEVFYPLSYKLKQPSNDSEEDLKDDINTINFGLITGCGFEIRLEEHLYFFLEIRYFYGITNIIKNPSGNESQKPEVWLFSIGLKS